MAARFVAWLDLPPALDWVDIGCGTGALTSTILATAAPRSLVGIDQSEGFLKHARAENPDPRARFVVGDAGSLPCPNQSVDAAVSALAYNFFPDRPAALAEMRRVSRPGATVALYVWDYPGGGVGFISAFWRAATALDPAAAGLAEGVRFPFCTAETLAKELADGGLNDVEVQGIEHLAAFAGFDDFWVPFTLGAGPAPGYYQSLHEERREALESKLRSNLGSGPIEFLLRAWAMRGTVS
jgi:SAM-dependent methyltransferase